MAACTNDPSRAVRLTPTPTSPATETETASPQNQASSSSEAEPTSESGEVENSSQGAAPSLQSLNTKVGAEADVAVAYRNSDRSQMAEAFLRAYAGDRYEAHSAGLYPKGLNPYTVQVIEEKGISLEGHRSKDVKEYLANSTFSYFLTVCNHAEENCPKAFLMSAGRHYHWDFEDPAAFVGSEEETLDKFRAVRDQLETRVKTWIQEQVPVRS